LKQFQPLALWIQHNTLLWQLHSPSNKLSNTSISSVYEHRIGTYSLGVKCCKPESVKTLPGLILLCASLVDLCYILASWASDFCWAVIFSLCNYIPISGFCDCIQLSFLCLNCQLLSTLSNQATAIIGIHFGSYLRFGEFNSFFKLLLLCNTTNAPMLPDFHRQPSQLLECSRLFLFQTGFALSSLFVNAAGEIWLPYTLLYPPGILL